MSVPAGVVTHTVSSVANQASNEFRRQTSSTATSCAPESNPEPEVRRVVILDDDGTDGKWTPGDRIRAVLLFTQTMTVSTANGAPTVSLRLGSDADLVQAQYAGIAYYDYTFVFEHHVAAGQGTVRQAALVADSLALNGGEIVSLFGISPNLAHSGVSKRVRPAPATRLTASWAKVPPVHSGNGTTFSVRLQFSDPVTISKKKRPSRPRDYGDRRRRRQSAAHHGCRRCKT